MAIKQYILSPTEPTGKQTGAQLGLCIGLPCNNNRPANLAL